MQQIIIAGVVVLFCGGIGGFVNALLAGDLHLPHPEPGNLYSTGWIGNVVIGAIAALVFWGLYGPAAKVALIGQSSAATPVAFTIAEIAGSLVTGIGGGRILSSEVEKKAMTKTTNLLAEVISRGGDHGN
ncbi:MAG TPA: hypothetical protein VF713_19025 [Thermoanaerobaculia bacterium]